MSTASATRGGHQEFVTREFADFRSAVSESFVPLQVRSASDPASPIRFRHSLDAERPKLCERGNRVNRICLSDSGKGSTKSTQIALSVPKRNVKCNDSIRLVNLRT